MTPKISPRSRFKIYSQHAQYAEQKRDYHLATLEWWRAVKFAITPTQLEFSIHNAERCEQLSQLEM